MARESITAGATAGGTRRAATHYGRRTDESAAASTYHIDNDTFQQVTTFRYDDLPTAAEDQLKSRVPASARVISATLKVTTTFTTTSGTTTFTVGLQEADGTEIDNDGLIASTGVDTLDAGDYIDGAGALVGAATGTSAEGQLVFIPSVADLTAGEATLTIVYETADDRNQVMNG